MSVREFKCPHCGGIMHFSPEDGKVTCEYCESEFSAADLEQYAAVLEEKVQDKMDWVQPDESHTARESTIYTCPACGGEIITDDVQAATRCPYCDTPAVMTSRVSGVFEPDMIIPFSVTKEQAQQAYRDFCRKKPLLPSLFTKQARIESITGIYVPFWLFDCDSNVTAEYRATRVTHWSDRRFDYTKTDHYHIFRRGDMQFRAVPVDGSKKLDNAYTESIEPFDCAKAVPFQMGYLTGFLADKYDENAQTAQQRANERIRQSALDAARETVHGYATLVPEQSGVQLSNTKASYALLPVWLLNTKFNGKIYTFAMNGQTGRFVGELPSSAAKGAGLFFGLTATITAVLYLLQLLLF